jgi:hypothetical protein
MLFEGIKALKSDICNKIYVNSYKRYPEEAMYIVNLWHKAIDNKYLMYVMHYVCELRDENNLLDHKYLIYNGCNCDLCYYNIKYTVYEKIYITADNWCIYLRYNNRIYQMICSDGCTNYDLYLNILEV